jgi:hypothetical protein
MSTPKAALTLLAQLSAVGLLAAQTPQSVPGGYASWQRATPTHLGAFSTTTWLRMDTVTTWVLVGGSPPDVYRRARKTYESLKIKVNHADSMTGLVGNTGFNHTGAIGGRRMSSWVSCGEGMTGPNADTWRVTLAVITWVEPITGDTSKVRTTVMASARNLAEGSRIPSPCVTTGQMEAEIHKKVLAMPPTPGGNE